MKSDVNVFKPAEELSIQERALAEWKSKHVQVLIDDDTIDEELARFVLDFDKLVNFLEQQEVPTRVIIDGRFYYIMLRRYLGWEKFKEFVEALNDFLRKQNWTKAVYNREKHAFIVDRWRE